MNVRIQERSERQKPYKRGGARQEIVEISHQINDCERMIIVKREKNEA